MVIGDIDRVVPVAAYECFDARLALDVVQELRLWLVVGKADDTGIGLVTGPRLPVHPQ
jgi:hypothetical protein